MDSLSANNRPEGVSPSRLASVHTMHPKTPRRKRPWRKILATFIILIVLLFIALVARELIRTNVDSGEDEPTTLLTPEERLEILEKLGSTPADEGGSVPATTQEERLLLLDEFGTGNEGEFAAGAETSTEPSGYISPSGTPQPASNAEPAPDAARQKRLDLLDSLGQAEE